MSRVDPQVIAKAVAAAVSAALEAVDDEPAAPVLKESAEQRYVLGVAWMPGQHTWITKGQDGARDFMTEENVEKAAWGYINHRGVNIFHTDGTEGHARVVESYVYRGPDWTITDTSGAEQVIKAGTWLVGSVLDEAGWAMYKAGQIAAWSAQGTARRRTPTEQGATADV